MEVIIRIGYAIMIIAVVMVFVLSRKHVDNLRKAIGRFAMIYCQIANHVSPRPFEKFRLRSFNVKNSPAITYRLEDQPLQVKECLIRAREEKLVLLFSELGGALQNVEVMAGRKKKNQTSFFEPIEQLYLSTHLFLTISNDQRNISDKDELLKFNNYIREQADSRLVLFKRISGRDSSEFMELNELYREHFLDE